MISLGGYFCSAGNKSATFCQLVEIPPWTWSLLWHSQIHGLRAPNTEFESWACRYDALSFSGSSLHHLRQGTRIVRLQALIVRLSILATIIATAAAITRSATGMMAIVQYRLRPQCPHPSRIELRWLFPKLRKWNFWLEIICYALNLPTVNTFFLKKTL